MKTKKTILRATGLILSLVLLLSAAPLAASAAPAAPHAVRTEISDTGFGVTAVNEDGTPAARAAYRTGKTALQRSVNLPAAYDARTDALVTTVKDQGLAGCCWAFATASAMETSALKQGLAVSPDYAEAHLAVFALNTAASDPADPTYGDGRTMGGELIYDHGGNYQYAAAAIARGSGMAPESAYPFDAAFAAKTVFPESDRYVSELRLAGTDLIDCFDGQSRSELIADVKTAILESGSVTAGYYDDQLIPYRITEADGARAAAYYSGTTAEANHMIQIVGWDDAFSADRFATAPQGSGAWLCKNSWGTDSAKTADGYFYLSYYEPSLSDFAAYTAMAADAYDVLYQYDGVGYGYYNYYEIAADRQNNKPKIANVFTAGGAELLDRIGFWTALGNTAVRAEIYTGVADGDDPTDGTLAATAESAFKYAGYHTVELSEAVALNAGERFSVCLYSYADGYDYWCVEGASEDGVAYASAPGQSYQCMWDNDAQDWVWSQTDAQTNNGAIKAMTVRAPEHTHTPGDPVTENEDPATCAKDGSYELAVYCTGCGAELSRETVTTGKLRHVSVTDPMVPPTCTEDGLTEGSHCRECGAVLTPQKPIPATHTPGRHEKRNENPADCHNEGSYEDVLYCAVCSQVITVTTVSVPKLQHVWNAGEITAEPTCTAKGQKIFVCTLCGDEKAEDIAKTAHTDADGDYLCDDCGAAMPGGGDVCKYCHKVHTGFFGAIVRFFHNIAYFFQNLFRR